MTLVLESSFSALSLPDSVSVLLERSKLWTRPWSALAPAPDESPVEAVALLLPGSVALGLLAVSLVVPLWPLWPMEPDDRVPAAVPVLESRLAPVDPAVSLP
jgi:hypothetical protein